jgi:hypothetical protein
MVGPSKMQRSSNNWKSHQQTKIAYKKLRAVLMLGILLYTRKTWRM